MVKPFVRDDSKYHIEAFHQHASNFPVKLIQILVLSEIVV